MCSIHLNLPYEISDRKDFQYQELSKQRIPLTDEYIGGKDSVSSRNDDTYQSGGKPKIQFVFREICSRQKPTPLNGGGRIMVVMIVGSVYIPNTWRNCFSVALLLRFFLFLIVLLAPWCNTNVFSCGREVVRRGVD